MNAEQKMEMWAIVELFGHNQIAGLVGEQEIGGQAFVRVDVPETDGLPGFTKFYGSGAIYAITPTTEGIVRLAVGRLAVKPINIWIPEINRVLPPPTVEVEHFELEESDYGDGEHMGCFVCKVCGERYGDDWSECTCGLHEVGG
jgi:hypothetical protein